MTAKIVKGSSFSGAIGYMLSKKEKAEILKAEGVRIEPKELTAKSFELQASMNPNIKKPVWHISLNFSENDKDKLSNEKMIKIAEAYLQKMNIRNTQYLIVRHHDRKHPHIHLCINRIDNEGKLISDKNEKYRSTKVCRELTEKHGLYIAPGKENVNRERLIGYDKTKYEIYDALKQAIPKSKTWNDLEKQLKKNGITFQFKTAGKTTNIQGIIFEKDGIKINGSKVDRNCSFSKIDREIKDNAYQALQEAERQAQQTGLAESAVETLSSLIAQLSIFTTPNSSHYDATLAEYIQALKARKWAAKNRIKIHRIRQNQHKKQTIMATTDNENILMMFEEINQKLDKTHLQIEKIGKQPSTETIEIANNELIAEIRQVKTIIEGLNNEHLERLSELDAVLRKEKRRIDFSPTSINTMLIVLGFMAIILGLTLWGTSLKAEKELYSDNDLKYRYIQMIGHATKEEMATMDTIFYFHRNNRKIKELRKQVEIFEENVKQRARIIEQEERLKREKYEIETQISVNQ